MNRSDKIPIIIIVLSIFILIFPFLMFHWMVPFVSDWTIGNDYTKYPIYHQIELMFAMKTGTFPLFIPGFAGGQSSSALTLGQIFHPISHITSILPGYWNGKALEWNTLFRLLSLGMAHLLLFTFIKKLRIEAFMAFILSFITVYNLRMLDLFRYGASLESWTGFLFLVSAIGWYFLKPTKWKGPLFIIGSTYWLVSSGHPQMMYYGLLGSGLFALIIPYFIRVLLPDRQWGIADIYKFWLRVGSFCGIGILLSSAYILPFYFDFIAHNSDRVARSYVWADAYRDTLVGTLNNFFHPLRSDVAGVFGGSSLILLVALVPVLRVCRVKVPLVIWTIWGLLFVSFLHMQGARTLVHYLAWKYIPFASSFRVPGRVSMIMPIFFMLVMVWIMLAAEFEFHLGGRKIRIYPQTILTLIALILIAVYLLLPDSIVLDTSKYSATAIRKIPTWVEPLSLTLGVAALVVLMLNGYFSRVKFATGLSLCLFISVQVMLLLQYGTWVEAKKDTPRLSMMRADKKESLNYRLAGGAGLTNSDVVRHVKRSFLEPYLGKIYRSYRYAEDNEMAYVLMERNRSSGQVTIEKYKKNRSHGFRKSTFNTTPNRVGLIYSSYNRLVFDVRASDSGFFGLAYPYTGHWKALVNNREAFVYRANGIAHAVEVPAGFSKVEFRYWSPAAFWGMAITCTTLMLIGFILSFRSLAKPKSILAAAVIFALVAGGFTLWHRSLYNGDNLGTAYAWNESPSAAIVNLAYGKRTNLSSLFKENYIFYNGSGRAVDGQRDTGSGFITALEHQPWWIVDLNEINSIGALHIYESYRGPRINQRPLKVTFSDDGHNWRPGAVISEVSRNGRLSLVFEEPQKARYVLIRSSGTCHLSFDEVEIFLAQEKTS